MSYRLSKTGFLSAKVHPQRVARDLVDRQPLLDELQKFQCHPTLSLLVAPAGYGKSTLLCQLMHEREAMSEIVAWLSLDDNDNTPSVFATYLLSSFSTAMSEHKILNTELAEQADNANPKEKLILLFNAVELYGLPVTAILDDFHVIKNHKLLRLVDWVLRSMPANLSLIIASREKPELEVIPELKAKSNFVEIDGNRLVFTLNETRLFFSSNVLTQNELDDQSLATLYEKTEGWVAALQMVQLALRDHPNPTKFIKDFSGTDKDIVSYLGGCVVAQLEPDVKSFMLRTSVLERMNGDLCRELTGRKTAVAQLIQLKRAGLFVFAIDRENNWYRYHHLFRDFLRAQLKEKDPESYYELCQRAGAWFERSGHIDEAVGYYLNANEYGLASNLIAQRASMVVQYQGQHETLLNWLKRLPTEHINRNPKILVNYLWSLNFMRYFKRYALVLDDFKANRSSNQESEYLTYNLEMLDCMQEVLSGKQLSARDKCVAWLEQWQEAPQFERGCVLASLGANALHTLEYKLARRSISEASNEFYQCQSEYGVAWAGAIQALACLRQGFTQEAKDTLQTSLTRSNELLGQFSFTSAMLSLGLAEVHYNNNELDEASRLIDKGFLYIEEHGLPDTTIAGYTTKAKILLSQGKTQDALETLRSGEHFGREQDIVNFEFTLSLERGQMLIQSKMITSALAIRDDVYDAQTHDLLVTLTPYEKLLFDLYKIRLNIALNHYDEAIKSLSLFITACKQKGSHSLQLAGLILQASALAKNNQMLKALRSFQQAILMAAPQNNIRLFIDEQEHIVELLPRLIKSYEIKEADNQAHSINSQFVESLVNIISGNEHNEPSSDDHKRASEHNRVNIAEQLTKRERQILDLLKTGVSNKELADALFISLATTKWHLSNIYSKLGVKNKIQAIRIFKKHFDES